MSVFKRENTAMKVKNKKRGVIYCRVSDLRQVDGYSLEIQERDCRLLAELNNIEVVKLFKDEGVSGKTMFRDEFQAMIDFIMENVNEVDYIIFYQLTRISRRLLDILELIELLNDLEIEFLSHKDGINDGVYGKFTLQLLGSLAELEIGQLKERVVPSMQARASQGKRNGGRYTPYGYKYKEYKINGKNEKRLVVEKNEAEQVKLIFELYTQNITSDDKLGMHLITKHLIENGYKYRKNKDGKVQDWTTKRVSSVLNDSNASLYNGYIEWGRYSLKPKKVKNKNDKFEIVLNKKRKPVMIRVENDSWIVAKGEHEAIITPEVYNLYKKRKENTPKPTVENKGRNATYHLTSILHCQDCGGVMDANNEKNGLVYKCRLATSKPGMCHSNTIRYDYIREDVETIFFSYLKMMVFTNIPKVILNEVIQFNKESNIDKRIIDIKAEMEHLSPSTQIEHFLLIKDEHFLFGKDSLLMF